jgi:hypothetical protein
MIFEEKILPFLKEHSIPIALGVVGIIFVGYGLVSIYPSQKTDALLSSRVKPCRRRQEMLFLLLLKKLLLISKDRLKKPGFYKFPANSRVQDALITASGLSQNADRQKVAQNLNFAALMIAPNFTFLLLKSSTAPQKVQQMLFPELMYKDQQRSILTRQHRQVF